MKPILYIFSGAGLDAESGIKTFRDCDGLWENFDLEEVCDINTFPDNYEKVHMFYNKLRTDLKNVKPNKAHEFIAEMQKLYGIGRVKNITSNVSDLLQRAGVQNTLNIHGNLTKVIKNYGTSESEEIDIGYTDYDYIKDVTNNGTYNINCKPSVTFFGEHCNAYNDMYYIANQIRPQDIVIIIGTSLQVVDYSILISESECYSILIDPSLDYHNPNSDIFDKDNEYSPIYYATKRIDNLVSKSAIDGLSDIKSIITSKMEL